MDKQRIVIKLSGSLFNFDTTIDRIKDYVDLIIEINKIYQPIVVTGGGKIARFYINICRDLGLDEAGLDMAGITVSHLNSKMLMSGLSDLCYPVSPKNLEEITLAAESNKIIVTGGLYPGQSTNATSALIAEKIHATKFINATDVAGIYDSDPNKNPQAKLYESINVRECIDMLKNEKSMAGTYDLMDLISLKVIERSKLQAVVLQSTPSNLRKYIIENVQVGTAITI